MIDNDKPLNVRVEESPSLPASVVVSVFLQGLVAVAGLVASAALAASARSAAGAGVVVVWLMTVVLVGFSVLVLAGARRVLHRDAGPAQRLGYLLAVVSAFLLVRAASTGTANAAQEVIMVVVGVAELVGAVLLRSGSAEQWLRHGVSRNARRA
jgi:hypothetical protein